MKVKKYKSNKEILIKVSKYLIDWKKAPSKGQQILQDFLYKYIKNHIVLAEFRIPGSLMRFDIVDCTTRNIYEFSPISHHNNYNPFFHKSRAGYLRSLKSDTNKLEWAEQNNFQVAEITDDDLPLLSIKYIQDKFNINIL